jgi:broad specificity phosphatase PhoE
MRILLVRHGESQGNVEPEIHARMADHAIPLSADGHRQAREAGDRIATFFDRLCQQRMEWPDLAPPRRPHVRLWTSPYRRTRETADAIEAAAGEWITDRREHVLLCEQQFGLFDGVPDEELATRFPQELAHYQKCVDFGGRFWARMPVGESRFDVALRVHQAFGTFQRDLTEGIENLVVVCHGVTLRAFVMMWCHLTPEWFEAERNPANCAIRLLEGGHDRGYLFAGFPRVGSSPD